MEGSTNSIANDYTEIVRRLPCKLRISYGVGHVLNDICASMWFTYLLVFFHYVLGFDPTYAGILFLVGQVADAVATPFVGLHSDRNDDFWLCRYGKRKTWHLLGTIGVLLSFPFIFSPCINCEESHQWAQLIYYAGFIIVFQLGWASVQISHLSLIPDLTPTEHERTELTAIRYSFTVFSNILVYCITWAVLHITSDDSGDAQIGPKDVYNFRTVVFIGLAIGTLTSMIFHLFVREGASRDTTGPSRRSTRSAATLLEDPQLYQVAGVYMPTRIFVNLSQIYVPLYLHKSLEMAAISLAIVPLTMFVGSFVASLLVESLNTRLGRKLSFSIGSVIALGACLWIRLGSGDIYVTYEIYVVALLLGASGSVMLVTSLGVTADFIGQSIDSGAFVYGAMSFTDKLSNGLVVMAIQHNWCTAGCSKSCYTEVLSYVCSGAAVLGLIMMLSIRPFRHDQDYRTLEVPELADPEIREN